MPCFKPLEAWRTSELTSKGKNAIVFQKSGKHVEIPLLLPCGQCIGCRLERSRMWAIRCVAESQLRPANSFITLTYADETLPSDGSLVPWHFTDFIKRLRHNTDIPLRYYMCGEYGEKLSRPHYHACLFGIDFPDKEIFSENEGILTYTSEFLENTWSYGFCTLGELNFETAAYTARYIAKKITGDQAQDHYTTTCPITGEINHLEPEYNRMSLRPGIAKDWYKQYKSDCYPSDFLVNKGKKIKIPRYFDKLLEEENPHELEIIKRKRKKNGLKHAQNNTPERLAVREKIQTLKYKLLNRGLET